MAQCRNCNAQLPSTFTVCPKCGGQVSRWSKLAVVEQEGKAPPGTPASTPPPARKSVPPAPRLPEKPPEPPPDDDDVSKVPFVAMGLHALLLVACLALLGTWLARRHARHEERAKGPSPAARLMTEVAAFRGAAGAGYFAALEKWGDENGRKRFLALDRQLWPSNDRTLGWAYFFTTSVACFGKMEPGLVPVAFYHPWSDVFLVTVWRLEEEGTPRIVDAEVMMGDFVRRRGVPKFSALRPWMKGDTYRVAAVGRETAATIAAFETLFGKTGTGTGDWRKAIPALADAAVMRDNRVGAAIMLLENFKELIAFSSGGAGDPSRGEVRNATRRFLAKWAAGRWAEAAAGATVDERLEASFKALPPEGLRSFKIVAFTSNERQSLVMLSCGKKPDIYMGLLFDRKGDAISLGRIDVMSFSRYYAKNKEGRDGGKKDGT